MINFVMDIIRGILIGIANVIPGVSGGTMAVSLGIYDKLISSLTGIFKNFKKSIQFLVPVILGAGIGIVGFAFMIEWLFEKYPLATSLTFVGLILGGIPILVKSLKGDLTKNRKKIGIGHIIAFILLFAFAIIMSMLSGGDTGVVLDKLNVGTICILFLIGMVASATMVIPGVSGSMVLMILYCNYNSYYRFFKRFKSDGHARTFAWIWNFISIWNRNNSGYFCDSKSH